MPEIEEANIEETLKKVWPKSHIHWSSTFNTEEIQSYKFSSPLKSTTYGGDMEFIGITEMTETDEKKPIKKWKLRVQTIT